jgi:predicted metal-dependent hydrolase
MSELLEPEPALLDFIELFNRGEYWESHERLETPWRANRSGFYKGLILFASAFVHAGRGNAHGIVAQLQKAEAELEAYRPRCMGMDVEAILEHARRCRDVVAKHPVVSPDILADLIPRMKLAVEQER